MPNYFLKIAYDGTDFGGWQIQPNAPTIQEEIQKAFQILLKHEVGVTGQGRTDAGVHALGQTAHFKTDQPIPKTFLRSANALLPPTIRLIELREVADHFHARYSAMGKTYHYYVTTDPVVLPFDRPYRLHHMGKLDLNKIRQAATLFVGTHDFTSFSNEAHRGSCSNDPVRTLKRVDIVEEPGGFRVEFEGEGFLYKMCRNIVGQLISVGRGHTTVENIKRVFEAKDRKEAEMAAPPQGLFLIRVEYPQEFSQS